MASIQRRVTSKGVAYIIKYYKLSGRRGTITLYGTYEEAQSWADALDERRTVRKKKIATGEHFSAPVTTLLSAAIADYKHAVSARKAKTTQKIETWVFKTFEDAVDDMPLSAINLKLMERYVADRINVHKIDLSSLGIQIRTLKAFFNHQIKYGLMDRNPTAGLKIPKPPKKKIRFLSQDEIERFLGKVDNPDYHDLFMTYLNTGARHNELLPGSFTWDDVDLKGRRLQLTGKGSSGYVPMNKIVYKILKRRKKSGLQYPFEFDYNYLYKKFKKYMKAAGIEDATLHDLRKTFGSLLIAQKVDVFRVSKLLRHSSVTVTESHYLSILDRDLESTVQRLEKVFKLKKKKATS